MAIDPNDPVNYDQFSTDYVPELKRQDPSIYLKPEEAVLALRQQSEHDLTANVAPGVMNPTHKHDADVRELIDNAIRIRVSGPKARADGFGLAVDSSEDGDTWFIQHDEHKLVSVLANLVRESET